mmetsp:Transcript_93347/g.261053  ORF Transcript_93347/g.261053 Transcript_93347/m.261053 type:complete len:91 (-) Transcript_93347:705-977(-)
MWPHVHGKSLLWSRILCQDPFFSHAFAACTSFFSWLEHEANRSIDACLHILEQGRRAEKHCRMAIVATRMHFPFMPGFEVINSVCEFENR